MPFALFPAASGMPFPMGHRKQLAFAAHLGLSVRWRRRTPRGRNAHDASRLGAVATEAAGERQVARHDGHAAGVHGAEVGVLEEADHVRLASLLERHHGVGLEAEVRLEVRRDLADEALMSKILHSPSVRKGKAKAKAAAMEEPEEEDTGPRPHPFFQ